MEDRKKVYQDDFRD